MKPNHAPAPWHLGESNPWLIYAADGYAVADVRTWHGRHPDIGADARLIAAAPDLLAACQHVIATHGHHAQDDCKCEDCEYLRPITTAVNKALGQKDINLAPPRKSPDVKQLGAVTIARNGYIQELEAERDKAIRALKKWDVACKAADACNAEMNSDSYDEKRWQLLSAAHEEALDAAKSAKDEAILNQILPPDNAETIEQSQDHNP